MFSNTTRSWIAAGTVTASAIAFVACGTDGTADTSSSAMPEAGGGSDVAIPSSNDASSAPPDGGAQPADGSVQDAHVEAAPPACNGTLKSGDTTQTLTIGSVTRTFMVHVPASYTGKTKVPVVFDFHPLTVNASTWKLATGWSGVSDQKGFILVIPQGVGDSWNVGRCCDPALEQGIDDVAFTRAMIAKLTTDACIEPKRVYATGCSNGGGMSYRLACDAADVIAAVAPVDFDCLTGPTNNPSCGNCNPSRPISVTQFRGTSDNSVPYDGGPTDVVPGIEFPGAKANFADWAARNSCTGSAATDQARPLCETYAACGAGTETTLCTLPFGMHCASYIPFGIASVAWDMLEKSTLP